MNEKPPARPAEAKPQPAILAPVENARVLVVDDVAENRDLLVRRLSRMGIKDAVEAENGSLAMERLATGRFDLVLLDIMMPVMTGFEVLEKLNSEGRLHDLPVIVISALSEVDDIAKCIEAGAEDFLLKPFNRTLLRARVLSSLEKKFLRDQTRQELQRKQAELDEARTLQLALVPKPATIDCGAGRISIDLVLEPAKEVGGDLVDHFVVGDNLYILVLGDVSDKGAGAALMMARTCSLFRGLAARPDAEMLFASPENAVREVNTVLATGNASCMFVTLLLATFYLNDGCLRYVRAGHVPPWIRHGDGRLEQLDVLNGLPLGVMEDTQYTAGEFTMVPGDSLLGVTDGVTEAAPRDGRMFDEAGVQDWLAAQGGGPPRVMDLVAAVRTHEDGAPPSDDVAIILLHLHESAGQAGTGELILDETLVPEPTRVSVLVEKALDIVAKKTGESRIAHHVSLVLDELLTNIAVHGDGAGLPCRARVMLDRDRVTIVIEDRATPFDPRSLDQPDTGESLEDRAVGGMGAFLVLSIAQGFDYQSENGCNTTSLWIAREDKNHEPE